MQQSTKNVRATPYLALDLEMNQPSGKIIQVGVALGVVGQAPKTYDCKQWLIHPEEALSPVITTLTGITDAELAEHAVSWATMTAELSAFIEERKPFVNPVTWGGGDAELLKRSILAQGLAFPHMGRRWLDVKTWHTLIMLSQGRNPSGGLRSAMAHYKLKFDGQAHRADSDARNTLALFFQLLARQAELEALLSRAKSL